MHLPPQHKKGNIVYKLKIIPENKVGYIRLYLELRDRCREGHGMAIYLLGVSDKGEIVGLSSEDFHKSFSNLTKLVNLNKGTLLQKTINQLGDSKFWATVFILNYDLQKRDFRSREVTYSFNVPYETALVEEVTEDKLDD